MTDEPEELVHRERKRIGPGFMVLFVILSVYALSPPFVWIGHAKLGGTPGSAFQSMIQTVYFPLGFLSEHVGFVDDFYKWYVSLFPNEWYEYAP